MVQSVEAKAAEELARVVFVGRRRMRERSSGCGREDAVEESTRPRER